MYINRYILKKKKTHTNTHDIDMLILMFTPQ